MFPMAKDHRKAKMTPEALADAARLKSLWDVYKGKDGALSQAAFGSTFGIGSQSAMTQFINGKTPLSLEAAIGFSKGLGCDLAEFSPHLAAEASVYSQAASRLAHNAQEPLPVTFARRDPISVEEAVEKIAELLAGLDEDGREMASTALSNLARNPSKPGRAAQMLTAVMSMHPRAPGPEPEPQPPAGGRSRRKSAAAERRAPRPQLTVTAGGGQKMQHELPLKKVLEPAHDPFDEKNAPANERLWYEKVKAAPKAKQ